MSEILANVWEAVRATALVGTARQSPDFAAVAGAAGVESDDSLASALGSLDKSAPETALLDAATIVSLYQLAGRLPEVADDERPAPCLAEAKPLCSPRAARFLEQILAERGDNIALTHEWLRTAVLRGEIAPPQMLLGLLNIGRQNVAMRVHLVTAIGERGRWLAAQNSDWRYVLGQTGDLFAQDGSPTGGVDWETAPTSARVALLADLRTTDPARASDMVTAVWKQEKAETRRDFLTTFATGLSLDDETFLESALDDRGKDVRALACDLLALLPASEFGARMTKRANACVQIASGGIFGLGKLKMSAEPPAEAEYKANQKAMARDGITAKSEMHNVGDRAWWLQQIIRLTPLAHWDTARYLPAEYISAAQKTDWHAQFINGWMQAANREQNEPWQAALWTYLLEKHPNWTHYDVLDTARLVPRLYEELMLTALRQTDKAKQRGNIVSVLLQHLQQNGLEAPSPSFVRAVLLEVRAQMTAVAKVSNVYSAQGYWLYTLVPLAHQVSIEMAEEILRDWADITLADGYAQDHLNNFRHTLTTRRDMHKGFDQ